MSASRLPTPPTRPLGRRIPPPVWRVINRFMRFVLGLPFPTPIGRRLMLVDLTGRKTGRHWRQPVSYVRHDDTLLSPGGGNWKKNLVPGQSVRLHLDGRDRTATPEIVTEPDHAADLMAIMIAANPAVTRFSGIGLDAHGRPDASRLEQALQHGFAVVCWHLDQPDPSRPGAVGVTT